MRTKIELYSKQPSDSHTAPVVAKQAALIANNLFGLSKYMVDALSFQSYRPFILNLVARRVPQELRNHLIKLGQYLYKNKQSYCDRFSNGELNPDRHTPHQPKRGCQITLESIIDDIQSIAKTFTSYKSDLLKLIGNGTINKEDIDRHFQIIDELDQFEKNILLSLESTPEYKAAKTQPIHFKIGEDLHKNKQSYCDHFSNGVLIPDRHTAHQPKRGFQITLESIIDDIKSVTKTFTSYKSDLLKLVGNETINEEDIDRYFQIIHDLGKFEKNILFSLDSMPKYKAAKTQSLDLKSGKTSDLMTSWGEDIDEIYPNTTVTIPQHEDCLGRITSFLYHEETRKMAVNLFVFPKPHEISLASTDCLVLGDLHANPIKLIYFLLYENIIQGISEEEYKELLEICCLKRDEDECLVKGDFFSSMDQKHPRNKLKRFNEIIKKLTPVNESAAPAIVLLGDVLADRGNNDYYTLKVLEQLSNHKIFPKILLSNHDREFVAIYENDGFGNFEHMSIHTRPYKAKFADPRQEYSLMELGNYLRLGLITEKEILHLVENVYLPLLTGLELSVDSDSKVLICFTHAPVPITIITELAKQLGLSCDDATLLQSPEKLVEMTDAINIKLKELLREKKLLEFSKENTPLYNLMWKRVPTDRSCWARNTLLPIGWSMTHVHGHDSDYDTEKWKDEKEKLSIYNLDNYLGKDLIYRGNYTVFYYGNNPCYIEKRVDTPKAALSISAKLASSSGIFFHEKSVSLASPDTDTSTEDSITPVSVRHGG